MERTETPRAGATGLPTPDVREIEAWIVAQIANLLGIPEAQIDVHKAIAAYGVDSAEAAALVADLEDWLECTIPLDLVWEWASTREVACRLAEHFEIEAAA
jgi:acyl carrier protein